MAMIWSHGGPQTAPVYLSNGAGTASWCGKQASELTDQQLIDIYRFCNEEGRCAGQDDVRSGNLRAEAGNPFHREFLDGVPYLFWSYAYRHGVWLAAMGARPQGRLVAA